MRTTAVLPCALLLAASCGPSKKPVQPKAMPGLCTLQRKAPPQEEEENYRKKKKPAQATMGVKELKPEEWFTLLLRGYTPGDAAGGEDCTGQPISWQEPQGCMESAPAAQGLGAAPLTDDDVIIARHKGDTRIVWVIARRFDDGEGEGPVALVEFTPQTVEVRAIGTLRALTKRPRLRLEKVDSAELLVADGEVCGNDDDPSSCKRAMRLLVRRGDRYVTEPVRLASGECVGPALFPLARDKTVSLQTGWNRRFDLNTTLTFDKGIIKVHEQVVVHDSDPAQPADPPRLFRRADADRYIRVAGDHLLVGATSLWGRMLDAWASVEAPPANQQ